MKMKLFIAAIILLVLSLLVWISLAKQHSTKTFLSTSLKGEVDQTASTENQIHQSGHYKNLLFVDQSLEELVTDYSPRDIVFSEPFKHLYDGDSAAEKKSLQQVLVNPVAEVRHKLWAWRALRQLGETPPAASKDEVHGVVFEIPINNWVDTLAVYSDGRIRYLNGKLGVPGGLIVWEDTENLVIKPLAMKVIDAAQALVGRTRVVDSHNQENPVVEPRITVLTYNGLYIFDRASTNSYLLDPVLATGTQLFVTLAKKALNQSKPNP